MKTIKGSGGGCLTVFGSIFLLVGLGVGFLGLKPIWKSFTTQNWQQVPATILEVDMKRYAGDSDSADTFKVIAKYRYQWEGTTYHSERVNFASGSDSFEDYHRDLRNELSPFVNNNNAYQVWVNPKNPSEAVLKRDIRWSMVSFMMIFPLVFGGAGLGIILLGRYGGKKIAAEQELQTLYPQMPWKWNPDWQTNELKNSSKVLLYSSGFFAFIWNAISMPMAFLVLPSEISDGNYAAFLVLLFPLVGLGLLYWVLVNWQRWKRFKDASLILDSIPIALGHRLKASFAMDEQLPLDARIKVLLSAKYEYTSGSGDDRKTRTDILWQDEQVFSASAGSYSDRYRLNIEFPIPIDQPETEDLGNSKRHYWEVKVSSQLPGADLDQSYEIPVYDSAKHNIPGIDSAKLEAQALQSRAHESKAYSESSSSSSNSYQGDWTQTGVQMENTVEGSYYFVPPARHKGMAVTISLMALIFGGIGLGLFFFAGNRPWIISIVFSLFGAGMLYSALRLWFYKVGFIANRNQLVVREGMFMMKEHVFNSSDIKELTVTSNMSSGDTKYYTIDAETYLGRKVSLAKQLLGKRDVEALRDRVLEELGRS